MSGDPVQGRVRLEIIVAVLAGFAAFALSVVLLDPGLLTGGRRLTAADEQEIRTALSLYNRIYQDFFASGGSHALLDEFPAERAERHRVFRDIGFVRDAGLVLVQDLANATVREVRASGPGEAEALVWEEWNFLLQRAEDRRPAESIRGLGQGFRYLLRREGGRWAVARWDPVDLPAPPVEGGRTW